MTTKKAEQRRTKVHKRVYISRRTDLMLTVMNSLMQNDVYDEFVERAIVLGLAVMNDDMHVNFEKWTDQLKLPTLKEARDYFDNE